MKIYSKGRSEVIEQAGRRLFHMGFDVNIDSFGMDMEADLALPQSSGRRINMMTALNEELINASRDFLSGTQLYGSGMEVLNEDNLYTVVTRVLHNAIQKLNEKGEPMWNIFVKTPKAKANELKRMKKEYLGKEFQTVDAVSRQEVEQDVDIPVVESPKAKTDTTKKTHKKKNKEHNPITRKPPINQVANITIPKAPEKNNVTF